MAVAISQHLHVSYADPHSQDKLIKNNARYADFWNPGWDKGRLSVTRDDPDGAANLEEPYARLGASATDCFRTNNDHGFSTLFPSPEALNRSCNQGPLHDAVLYAKWLHQQEVSIPSSTFVSLLERCMEEGSRIEGREVHNLIIKGGHETDMFLGSYLIRMYVLFKDLVKANEVFRKLVDPNVFAWTAIISAHGKLGQEDQAIYLYYQMHEAKVTPDSHVFAAILKSCHDGKTLKEGRLIHKDIILAKLESDVLVGNALIDMYSNCGSLADARAVFEKLSPKDITTWNAIISGHSQNDAHEEAFVVFDSMQEEGIEPHRVTYVCMLKACASLCSLEQGRRIHSHIIESGFESEIMVGCTLVDMYCKCGYALEEAYPLSARLPFRDVYTWSALIGGFAQNKLGTEAFVVFEQMQEEGMQPSEVTFVHMLKACACIGELNRGEHIYSQIVESGFVSDVYIVCTLIDMFSKCRSIMDAYLVFQKSPNHTVATWNALITGCICCGEAEDALVFFEGMQHEGLKPDSVTFVSVLKACSILPSFEQGNVIHALVTKVGMELNVLMGNTLIDMYGKMGSLLDAHFVFDRLHNRDIVTWTTLIAGYAEHGHCESVIQLYAEMLCDGMEPNEVTFICMVKSCVTLHQGQQIHAHIIEGGFELGLSVGNTLVSMYSKLDSVEVALLAFERLQERDVVSWNALIGGCTLDECNCKEALHIFHCMQLNEIKPDHTTFLAVLKACSQIGALEQGRQLHAQLNNIGLEMDMFIGTTLIGMYSKCGCIEDAHTVFDRLQLRDVGAWNALIAEYAQHNNYWMAFLMFEDMQQEDIQPNGITFLCILSACSHVGLQDEGFQYFKSMRDDHRIKPSVEHHNSIVELLGFVGDLNAAEDLLETIPFQCDAIGWTSLLSSCKKQGNPDVGRRSFNQAIALESRKAAAYVIMADIYERAGMYEHAKKIEDLKSRANVWKKPARAFIEIDNEVHTFSVDDKKHPQSRSIYAKIEELDLKLEEHYQTSHPYIHEDKEIFLCGHSEIWAIAFGLINTPEGTSIRVTKNMRMCSNCHRAAKAISQIEGREVIVRDAYCIHHFMDGECSCEDQH